MCRSVGARPREIVSPCKPFRSSLFHGRFGANEPTWVTIVIDLDFRKCVIDSFAMPIPSSRGGGKSALFLASSINFIPRNGRGERRNEMEGERRREKERRKRERETVAYNVFVSRGKKGKRRASKWFVMTRKTVKPNRAPKIQPLGATTPRSSSSSSPASRFVEKLCDGTVLRSKLH